MHENDIGTTIVDEAVKIHQAMGPGLLETVYETILAKKLARAGLKVGRQVPVPIRYEGLTFEEGFRADLIIENMVIVELKSVERVSPVHKKQLLTYLKLTNMKLGYLLNFGVDLMKSGITRTINGSLG